MSYITALLLAESPGAKELAEVASSEHEAIVVAELMDLTLRGSDRSTYDSDEIAAADEALARIEALITETDELIDGYLARRYSVPLAITPSIITGLARRIVRYRLHKDLRDDDRSNPIVRDYKDALKTLGMIGDGEILLGPGDAASADESAGQVQFESPARVFGRDACGRSTW